MRIKCAFGWRRFTISGGADLRSAKRRFTVSYTEAHRYLFRDWAKTTSFGEASARTMFHPFSSVQ
jgi:hypothetical protein